MEKVRGQVAMVEVHRACGGKGCAECNNGTIRWFCNPNEVPHNINNYKDYRRWKDAREKEKKHLVSGK